MWCQHLVVVSSYGCGVIRRRALQLYLGTAQVNPWLGRQRGDVLAREDDRRRRRCALRCTTSHCLCQRRHRCVGRVSVARNRSFSRKNMLSVFMAKKPNIHPEPKGCHRVALIFESLTRHQPKLQDDGWCVAWCACLPPSIH